MGPVRYGHAGTGPISLILRNLPGADTAIRGRRFLDHRGLGQQRVSRAVAFVQLSGPFLYVSREVDGEILALLDETQETVRLYQQLESERGRVLFEFGLLYLGFAVILILAAIWLGLWFAERLSGPVGRLTGAAQRVGAGDLDVQVREEEGDDEIAMLGRYFNQMTKQLKAQRETLLTTPSRSNAAVGCLTRC